MNKAQKFLINKGYSDLVITNPNIVDPEKWVYVSDAIMEFQHNLTRRQSRAANVCACKDGGLFDFGNSNICINCDGTIPPPAQLER